MAKYPYLYFSAPIRKTQSGYNIDRDNQLINENYYPSAAWGHRLATLASDGEAMEFSPRPSTSSDVAALHWSPTTTNAAAIPVPASDFFAETLPFYSPEVEAIQNREFAEKQLAELEKNPFGQSFTSSSATLPPFERGSLRRDAAPFQIGGSDSFFVPTRSPVPLHQEVSGEQRYTPKADMVLGRIPIPPEDVGTNFGGFGGSADETLSGEQIQEGPGYWTNPDTGQAVDIESEMGPQYHSTIPMGYAPYDPSRQTGFFSNLGRRLMSGVTAPYRHFTDISDVPVTGSGIGAAASTFGPLLASAAIPGGGLFSLLSRMIPDSGPTPYQQEGRNVSDISFGPKTAWLGADVPGGGYYIPNQKIDMAQLGGGRTPGGRGITVHTPEGLVDATYRVDPTGAASITSKGFGAPGVDYGDLYYGGADYEGLDTGQFDDIFSGDEDWF